MFEEHGVDDLITIQDLARWLVLSKRTVENYRQHYPTLLPPATVLSPRTVRYRVGSVREWLQSRQAAC